MINNQSRSIGTLLFLLVLFGMPNLASAADKYWVGGDGNWDASSTAHWAATSGGLGGEEVPTPIDDVYFDANSTGVITTSIDDTSTIANNLDFTGFTGTLVHGTAGKINVYGSLTMVNEMTYDSNTATREWNFNATSLGNTIDFADKTNIGNITFNGAGGAWTFSRGSTIRSDATVTLTNGNLKTDAYTHTWGNFNSNNGNPRTLDYSNSIINITSSAVYRWDINNSAGLILIGDSISTLNFVSTSLTQQNFNGGGASYPGTVRFLSNGIAFIRGVNTFNNLSYDGSLNASSKMVLRLYGNQTITGTLTLNGGIDNRYRLLVDSYPVGNNRSLYVNGNISAQRVDFQDVTGLGQASWNLSGIVGGAGNGLGNIGITFSPSRNLYWNTLSGGIKYYSAYTGTQSWFTDSEYILPLSALDSPLPQDNVFFTSTAVTGATTIKQDTLRAGTNLDFTGATSSLTFSPSVEWSIYGSLKMVPSMIYTAGNFGLIFKGRETHNITTGTQNFAAITFDSFGGNYTSLDDITALSFKNVSGTIHMGNVIWKTTDISAKNVWSGNAMIDAGTSTLILSGNSTTGNRTFAPADGTIFNNINISGQATGTSVWNIPNNFSFNTTFTVASPNHIKAPNGNTYTIINDIVHQLPAFDLISPTNNTSSTTNPATFLFSWEAYNPSTTEPLMALSKYQLYIDGTLHTDNIIPTSTSSLIDVGLLSYGKHTWQIRAINVFGNYMWSTSTFNIAALNNWVKYGTKILGPGPEGSFDASHVVDPSVLKDSDGTYKMWYVGINAFNVKFIGLATSPDGINWTKYSNNPVLTPGNPGSYDENIWEARVLKDGDIYKMWYQSTSDGGITYVTNYATSPDGINWTKYSNNPVLTPTPETWDSTYAGARAVIKVNNIYKMWYETGTSVGNVGYATSPDGINWTKSPDNPILSSTPGLWDYRNDIPNVVLVDNVYYMYYSTNLNLPTSLVGLATSTDGESWTKNVNNPIINMIGSPTDWDTVGVELVNIMQPDNSGRLFGYYRAFDRLNNSSRSFGLISNLILTHSTTSTSITLSVPSFLDYSTGSSGYYFYRVEDPTYNSGWIHSNSWTDETDLDINTSYTYYVKYRDKDGMELAYATTTSPIYPTPEPKSSTRSSSRRLSAAEVNAIFGTPVSQPTQPVVPTQPSQPTLICPNPLTQNLKAPSRNGTYNSYTGTVVTEAHLLQAHLNRLGFNAGVEDGILGPLTNAAIKRMQVSLGVTPDGYVGPSTRNAINASCTTTPTLSEQDILDMIQSLQVQLDRMNTV